MKRKVSILTLAFLFFTATTGLPVTLHYCKMMESASYEVCEMHKPVKIENSCCEKAASEYPVKLTSENSFCCQTEVVYNKVNDLFLTSKTENNSSSSFEILYQPIVSLSVELQISVAGSFYNDSSPPFLINPDLHITNSVLLI